MERLLQKPSLERRRLLPRQFRQPHFARRGKFRRQGHRLAQILQVNRTPDFHRAEVFQMVGHPLDVEQTKAVRLQNAHQRQQGHL